MKSIKPGRGPSAMGFIGSIAAVIFGIFWTIMAASMGAPVFFPFFGVIFIVLGIVQAFYNYKNATGSNRFSTFDITSDDEETDPLNELFGKSKYHDIKISDKIESDASNFCPYCGTKTDDDFKFCRKCGKSLE
jgi:hypothetical protein